MKKVLTLCALIFVCATSYSQEWIKITGDVEDGLIVYVDALSVNRDSGLVYAWVKWEYYGEKRLELIKDEIKYLKDGKYRFDDDVPLDVKVKWHSFRKRLYFWILNPSKNTYKITSSVYYSTNDDVLESYDFDEDKVQWYRPVPGSIGMSTFDAIARKKWVYSVTDAAFAAEKKIIRQALYDFDITIRKHPEYTDAQLFEKFPEFKGDGKLLEAAYDFSKTFRAKEYKDEAELESLFPEFFGKDKTKYHSLPLEEVGDFIEKHKGKEVEFVRLE